MGLTNDILLHSGYFVGPFLLFCFFHWTWWFSAVVRFDSFLFILCVFTAGFPFVLPELTSYTLLVYFKLITTLTIYTTISFYSPPFYVFDITIYIFCVHWQIVIAILILLFFSHYNRVKWLIHHQVMAWSILYLTINLPSALNVFMLLLSVLKFQLK